MTTGQSFAIGPVVRRDADGVPHVGYTRAAGVPSVTVTRWTTTSHEGPDLAHAHDFLSLVYVERGRGTLTVDGRAWALRDGDVLVIAPGAVMAADTTRHATDDTVAHAVFFPSDLVDPDAPSSSAAWRAHPLLYPFTTRRQRPAVRRLHAPAEERAAWLADLSALTDELHTRRDGYAEAARARVTLLLVRLARLEGDVPDDLRRHDEPLLAAAFDAIETRYREPISTRDVAAAVGVTPGHLTTVVRRGTGRTVGQWVTERRLQEARRLLATTDLTVAAVAGRVGYRDPAYFVRRFRGAHATTPLQWRAG